MSKVRLCPTTDIRLGRLHLARWRTAHRQGYQLKIFAGGFCPPILGVAIFAPPLFLNFGPGGNALKRAQVIPLLLVLLAS